MGYPINYIELDKGYPHEEGAQGGDLGRAGGE